MANYFHPTVKIADFVSIEVSNRGTNTSIGENSRIDDFVKIKHVGGHGDINIGKNVYVNSGTVFYSGNGIQIGDNVLIGPNCNLVPTNHEIKNLNLLICDQGFAESKGGIIIESNVWIGANVTLLDGAILRSGCVVGANSLVSSEIEENCIYAGSPAKLIKRR